MSTANTTQLRELASHVRGHALWGEPLAGHTTWGCGGPAELLIVPADVSDLVRALDFCQARGLPWRVMGNGSNLLVADAGLPGVVFKLRGTLEALEIRGERVCAGAGLMLPVLVQAAARQGLAGLETLAGIPGTVGGALAMNAGAFGRSLGECVLAATFWEAGRGVRTLGGEELGFAYRDSLLRHGRRVALEAELALARDDPQSIEARMRDYLTRRRQSQPQGVRSAGSVFRNPEAAPAGALIERAGLKGERCGGAEVSPRHANFIVNRGGATACDIRALIALVQERVRRDSGVELVCEVDIWE